tara:strand:+ start:138 stop:359 length:222 start_codon:yes stop_codon:yes gene_type:complete
MLKHPSVPSRKGTPMDFTNCTRMLKFFYLTGVNSPYEEPKNPNITINIDKTNIAKCTCKLFALLYKKNLIKKI